MNILPLVLCLISAVLLVPKSRGQVTRAPSPVESEADELVEELLQNDPNSTLIYDENGNPRDKRALGVLLQGLVQALGYNTTPVQLASLPNPNAVGTMAAGPISFDIRQAVPPAAPPLPQAPPQPSPSVAAQPQAAATGPRQRETLRFTGVVNFGNNSDILGHLRQYEQLFHGRPVATAAAPQQPPAQSAPATVPATAPAPTNSLPRPAGTVTNAPSALLDVRAALPEPYFVPIPIPLSPNIQSLDDLRYPPPPRISFVTTPSPTISYATQPTPNVVTTEYRNKEHKETHKVENEEIIGDRNPHLDDQDNDERIVENNRNREEEIVQKNQERPSQYVSAEKTEDDDSSEYNENTANEDGVKESDGGEVEDEEESKEQYQPGKEEEKDYEDEETSEEQKSASQKSKLKSKPNKLPTEDAERYVPKKYPSFYAMKLQVEDKPFRGPFMNSYGQSLEHGGKVDMTVADYFGKFKNAQSGLFDAQSIVAPAVQRRPWWLDGLPRDPIEKLQIEPRFPLQNEYEDYIFSNLGNKKSEEVKNDGFQQESKRVSATYEDDESVAVESGLIPTKRTQKLAKTNSKVLIEPFNFVKFTPYYRPVQYFFSPDSLEKSAQAILRAHHEQYKKQDENMSETEDEGDEPAPQTVVKATAKPAKRPTKSRKVKRPINKDAEKVIIDSPPVTTEAAKEPSTTPTHEDSGEKSYEDSYDNKNSSENSSSGEDYDRPPASRKEDPKETSESRQPQQKEYQDYAQPDDYADRSQTSEDSSDYASTEAKYIDDPVSKPRRPNTEEDYNDSISYEDPDTYKNSSEETRSQESSTSRSPSEYIGTNSEMTETTLMNQYSQTETESLGSIVSTTPRGYFREIPERGSTEVTMYQVQETAPEVKHRENVPITTYNPVTYVLRSGTPNIQYTYEDIEEANHPKVELQYHIPYGDPASSTEGIGASANYAFGRRLSPASPEVQSKEDLNKERQNRLVIINTDPPMVETPAIDNEFVSANVEPTQAPPQRKVRRRGSRKNVLTGRS
uniref:Uncharacterized protein n=1 Tax=Bracon brevicornis TaxID=1563983 RepID=A0A6V7IGX5_9HYME